MASLKDIAQDVGVSVSVVSRVLRNSMGKTRVRPEVARNIRLSAKQLGYRPNPAAQALSGGRQNVMGVLIHRIGALGSGIIESTIEGISVAAQRVDQRLNTMFFSSTEELLERLSTVCRDRVDGLLIIGRPYPHLRPLLLQTAREQVPVVTLYHTPLDPELPNVGLDQQHVGELAARHLIEQGCRRILYIYNIDRRHDGHRKVLAEAGIEYLPELIWRGDIDQFDAAAGESAVRSMIERGIRFDGVQAQSDAEAVGAINQLFRMGYSVPQQVKVIGVDDSPHCELSRVPLTSICQHYRERAETAVAMLHRAIEGDSVTSVQHTPTLRMRDSTATAV